MKSCLYNCSIHHSRSRPKRHAFDYRLFYFCIDLDELSELGANPLVSIDGWNAYSLRTSDHLDFGKQTIKQNLECYLRQVGYTGSIGRTRLVTQLRTFGHIFNPVSFYFVHDDADKPACIVAEVANTFNEQKLYYLSPETLKKEQSRDQQAKYFYISPFSELSTQLHFNLGFPGDRLQIQIRQSDAEGVYFNSTMTGTHIPLTVTNLVKSTIRFPFTTLQIVWGIHWQALKLFLKKLPVYGKTENKRFEKNVRTYLPHRVQHTQFQQPAI